MNVLVGEFEEIRRNSLHLLLSRLIGAPTVMTTPIITIAKLKVCCVARETLSLALKSDQETLPSSLITDICFLVGPELDVAARDKLFRMKVVVHGDLNSCARKETEELSRRKRLMVETTQFQHR